MIDLNMKIFASLFTPSPVKLHGKNSAVVRLYNYDYDLKCWIYHVKLKFSSEH